MPRRPQPTDTPPFIAIVGPTASGKSDLALAVADRLPVEIISADARQVYRGMDIGTAKPSQAERRAVPHHLLDVVEPDEPFSAAQWTEAARALLPEIAARGHLPLIVGGTGLYVSALVDGFDFASQPYSAEIRRQLAADLEIEGLPVLAERLTRLAPEVAARTDLRNPRRVLRALERAEQGSTSLPTAAAYPGRVTLIGLRRPRPILAERIERRARAMFVGGLLDEARQLLAAGYSSGLPAMSGHGYREASGLLAGEWGLDEAIERTTRRTRQYAKRQMTWFRRDPRISWLSLQAAPARDSLDAVLRLIGERDRPAGDA
jgi:tRNA dimethylallyltransferase